MPFTDKELEEMRLADIEIEKTFHLTQDDLAASRQRDRAAKFDNLPADKQRKAAARRAYYEANREKVAAAQRWIRDARRAHGFTQKDLSRMLGVTQPCIYQLETGRVPLDTFSKATRLFEILG